MHRVASFAAVVVVAITLVVPAAFSQSGSSEQPVLPQGGASVATELEERVRPRRGMSKSIRSIPLSSTRRRSMTVGSIASRASTSAATAGRAGPIRKRRVPPPSMCDSTRREELSAFGISIDPANPTNVYIGTSCGLAKSVDRGVSWSFVDPTPADPANTVWDVIAQANALVDICGDDGHARSANGGASFILGGGLPSGRCSLAVSPDESYVLFAAVGTSVFESDNGGASWPVNLGNPSPQGRIPFRRDESAIERRRYRSFRSLVWRCAALSRRLRDSRQPVARGCRAL